jgi:hypothetical protein
MERLTPKKEIFAAHLCADRLEKYLQNPAEAREFAEAVTAGDERFTEMVDLFATIAHDTLHNENGRGMFTSLVIAMLLMGYDAAVAHAEAAELGKLLK